MKSLDLVIVYYPKKEINKKKVFFSKLFNGDRFNSQRDTIIVLVEEFIASYKEQKKMLRFCLGNILECKKMVPSDWFLK